EGFAPTSVTSKLNRRVRGHSGSRDREGRAEYGAVVEDREHVGGPTHASTALAPKPSIDGAVSVVVVARIVSPALPHVTTYLSFARTNGRPRLRSDGDVHEDAARV